MGLQILRSPVRFRLRPETALFFLFCARARVSAAVGQNNTQDMSLWPNWTRRLTTNQKIGGSSPSRDMFFSLDHPRRLQKGHNGHRCQHTFYWGISSIGRVRALQARGTGIETLMLHATFSFLAHFSRAGLFCPPRPSIVLGWPSGPRRLTQVQVSPDAWVRIPLQACAVLFFACGSMPFEHGPLV